MSDEGTRASLPLTEAQQGLMLSVERLAHKLVQDIMPWARDATREDAVACGMYGAAQAAQRFLPAMGTRFASYATPWIAGEIRRYRDREAKPAQAARRATSAGRGYLAEEPDTFDVLWDERPVNAARAHDVTRRFLAAMFAGVGSGPADPESAVLDAERRSLLRKAMGEVAEGKRALLEMRYLEERPQPEIVAALGISERTARRWHDEALDTLAAAVRQHGLCWEP